MRPVDDGFEVLLVQRNGRGFFGDFLVFPGGRVDQIDVPNGEFAHADGSHRFAALRELAEEAGMTPTTSGMRAVPKVKGRDFYHWVADGGLELAIEELLLVSRWVTPEASPRRFDTRFYLLGCVDPPEVRIDHDELVGAFWERPAVALARFESGEWPMILPTLAHLRWLTKRSGIADAMESARGADGRTMIEPRRAEDGSILPIHMPADP